MNFLFFFWSTLVDLSCLKLDFSLNQKILHVSTYSKGKKNKETKTKINTFLLVSDISFFNAELKLLFQPIYF